MGYEPTRISSFLSATDGRKYADLLDDLFKTNFIGQLANRFDYGFFIRHGKYFLKPQSSALWCHLHTISRALLLLLASSGVVLLRLFWANEAVAVRINPFEVLGAAKKFT